MKEKELLLPGIEEYLEENGITLEAEIGAGIIKSQGGDVDGEYTKQISENTSNQVDSIISDNLPAIIGQNTQASKENIKYSNNYFYELATYIHMFGLVDEKNISQKDKSNIFMLKAILFGQQQILSYFKLTGKEEPREILRIIINKKNDLGIEGSPEENNEYKSILLLINRYLELCRTSEDLALEVKCIYSHKLSKNILELFSFAIDIEYMDYAEIVEFADMICVRPDTKVEDLPTLIANRINYNKSKRFDELLDKYQQAYEDTVKKILFAQTESPILNIWNAIKNSFSKKK